MATTTGRKPRVTTGSQPKSYKTLLKELKKANNELNKINQLKSDFISTISHEIRTPMALIRESVEQVSDGILGKVNKKQKRSLSITCRNIERLIKVLNSLLDSSKLDAGRVELKRQYVDVRVIIRDVMSGFRHIAKSKDITLKHKLPNKLTEVFLDAERIMMVISNLLSNAYKFTNNGGRITVELKDNKTYVEITVKDTGMGIAKENVPRLFEKFSQFGEVEDVKHKGTGLGLAIVKGIVDMHKGEIKVESALGKGTIFTVDIPRPSSEYIFKEYISYGMKEAVNKESALSIAVLRVENYEDLRKKANIEPVIILKGLQVYVEKVLRSHSDIFLKDTGECVVLLFGADKTNALLVKNKIADAARKYIDHIKDKYNFMLRISLGLSTYPEEADSSDTLLFKARVRLNPCISDRRGGSISARSAR